MRSVIFAFCYETKMNSSLSVVVNPGKISFTHGQFQVKDLMITKIQEFVFVYPSFITDFS